MPPFIVLRFRASGAPRLRSRRVKALYRNGRLAARVRACRTCRVVELGRRRLPRVVVADALTVWPLVGRCFAQPVGSTGRAAALSPIETWADLTETRLSRTGRDLGPVASNGRGQRRLRGHASKMSDLAVARDSARSAGSPDARSTQGPNCMMGVRHRGRPRGWGSLERTRARRTPGQAHMRGSI